MFASKGYSWKCLKRTLEHVLNLGRDIIIGQSDYITAGSAVSSAYCGRAFFSDLARDNGSETGLFFFLDDKKHWLLELVL